MVTDPVKFPESVGLNFQSTIKESISDSDLDTPNAKEYVMSDQSPMLKEKVPPTNLETQNPAPKPTESAPSKPLTTFEEISHGFDIYKNLNGLLKSRRVDPSTQVFELLRSISMLWIV
jgi:peptidoglycan/LPS O-acetylase OafA/YrhL